MKQAILKKLLLSGTAAFGVIGLSSPAAFAWSGNSGYGSSSYKQSSYSRNNDYNNNSRCYMMKEWGNKYGGCNKYDSHQNNNDRCNRYGGSESYGKSNSYD